MAEFPTTFVDTRYQMGLGDIAPKHSMPLTQLANRGYAVEVGLMREDVTALTEIASQTGTREYCPNDLERRWTDEATAEAQLAKDDGRGVFLLRNVGSNAITGFGWTGKSSDKEREHLPMCENTFAVRLHEDARGQGLAVPFSKIIVAGSMSIFRARQIGLETWASNNAAVNTYLNAGAQLVKAQNSARPTLHRNKSFKVTVLDDTTFWARDTRLYMNYTWSA